MNIDEFILRQSPISIRRVQTCDGHFQVDVRKVFCPGCSPPNHCSNCIGQNKCSFIQPAPVKKKPVPAALFPPKDPSPIPPDESIHYKVTRKNPSRETFGERMHEYWQRRREEKAKKDETQESGRELIEKSETVTDNPNY